MATVNKDFKVKHGLIVADGATFGGTVTAAVATLSTHLATKGYIDDLPVLITGEATAPDTGNEVDGQLYYDTTTGRLSIFSNDAWLTLASFNDTLVLHDHIHDTAIDGTGWIVTTLVDAGYYNDSSSTPEDAEYYNTASWAKLFDGGISIDNFN